MDVMFCMGKQKIIANYVTHNSTTEIYFITKYYLHINQLYSYFIVLTQIRFFTQTLQSLPDTSWLPTPFLKVFRFSTFFRRLGLLFIYRVITSAKFLILSFSCCN